MKKALGRGLRTLLPERPRPERETVEDGPAVAPAHGRPDPPPAPLPPAIPVTLPIDRLAPNPFQPRTRFDEKQLEELAQSIRADGVIQPLVVRQVGDAYQIIAGERRWRAARLAGLETVPVHLQALADDRMLEVALVENIQREDLNAIEAALAFQRLNRELGLNHEQIGRRTGKDRATITNAIRLLQLPDDLQTMVADRKLSPGHARALLKIDDPHRQLRLARQAAQQQWSVRRMEAETSKPAFRARPEPETRADPNVRAAIEELERALGTRVRIVPGARGRGTIEIDYYSPDDLDRIYAVIAGDRE